jgi:hypothetical protein
MARPKKTAMDYQSVTIRFPKDILEACRSEAEKEHRSLNEQLLHFTWQCLTKKCHERLPISG